MIAHRKRHQVQELRDLHKQQIWVLAARALVLLRNRHYERAESTLDTALAFAEDKLVADDYRCFGTLARLHYNRGLVWRNQGAFRKAERHFGVAWEMAVLRRDNPDSTAEPTASDRAFTTRCLARIQAFGIGLSHFSEGMLLLASLAFQTALELLASHAGNAAAERMAMETRIHQAVVSAMVAEFDENGRKTLLRVAAGLDKDRRLFTGDEPYLRLSSVTRLLIQARLHAIAPGIPIPSAEELKSASRVVHNSGGDLIEETCGLIALRCHLEAGTVEAAATGLEIAQLLLGHQCEVRFLRNEIRLCQIQSLLALLELSGELPDAQRLKWLRNAANALGRMHEDYASLTKFQQSLFQILTCELALVKGNQSAAILLWGRLHAGNRKRKDDLWRAKERLVAKFPSLRAYPLTRLPLPYADRSFKTQLPVGVCQAILEFNLICDAVGGELDPDPEPAALRKRVRDLLPDLDLARSRRLFRPFFDFLADADAEGLDNLAAEVGRYLDHHAITHSGV
jgi:tetratricopeptide (TPR) repeat protein